MSRRKRSRQAAAWTSRRRPTLRVDATANPTELCGDVARSFAPDLTDEEFVQGLRELADRVEAENAARQLGAVS